jgi:tRNA (adenine22-N1)-methyltransferase
VEDNQRFYEVMRVSTHTQGKPISPVGDKIWQYPELSARYLKKILNHYQRKQSGYNKSLKNKRYDDELKVLQETIEAYKAVRLAK